VKGTTQLHSAEAFNRNTTYTEMTWLVATNWRETKGNQTEVRGPLEECHSQQTFSDPTFHFPHTYTHSSSFSLSFFVLSLSRQIFPENGIFRRSFRPYLTPFWFFLIICKRVVVFFRVCDEECEMLS
jgi:hypothetical protein